MRLITGSLIAGLLAVGLWSQAAARGYEQGKADASHALTPFGVVVVNQDGTCAVYDQPGQTVTWEGGPARARTTLMIRPGS